MDLHDYKDVAENYDRYLEVMYRDFDAHEGFQDFYLELAKKYGKDGVIDVACCRHLPGLQGRQGRFE